MSMDLLNKRVVRKTLKSRWYPAVFQIITASAFILIMFQLLAGPSAAHDNFGTALTWVLWWPVIPIIFVFLGRFWCAICPFGTLSDLVQKFVGNQRPVPKFLKKYGIWIIDALFILITWSDHVWGIVENPWGSGVLLLLPYYRGGCIGGFLAAPGLVPLSVLFGRPFRQLCSRWNARTARHSRNLLRL